MKAPKLVPFSEFKIGLRTARHEQFAELKQTKNKNPDHFEEMKQHLLHYYGQLEAKHSFKDPAGQVRDCIPIEQQPSLKKTGGPGGNNCK